MFSTTADSAAFFSATSNRLSRVEATSASDTAGAATFGAGACLALALRRLVRPVAIASSRGTSEAFSFFGRPGRRRSVPCWASELSRTFLRRVSRVSAEAFFSSARAFSASKTPSSTFFSSDINLLSLHPAPHRKDFNSAHTAQSLVAVTAAQPSPYSAHSLALPGTISFSASAVRGERAERRARRDGHSHLALEHGTLTPFLGVLPVFGFLRRGGRARAVRQLCSAAYSRRSSGTLPRCVGGDLYARAGRTRHRVPLYPVECASKPPYPSYPGSTSGQDAWDRLWRSSSGHSKAGRATTHHPASKNFERRG